MILSVAISHSLIQVPTTQELCLELMETKKFISFHEMRQWEQPSVQKPRNPTMDFINHLDQYQYIACTELTCFCETQTKICVKELRDSSNKNSGSPLH